LEEDGKGEMWMREIERERTERERVGEECENEKEE